MNFLRERRKADGAGYSVEKIAKRPGLSISSVDFVLKTSSLYKKWVEHKGVDYFRAVSTL